MSAPSSPVSSRGGSPAPMLTPRSKIRALLATVDSSDEEGGAPTQLKQAARPSVRSALAQLDDDDSESDVEIRPRGRLAARMQANSTSPSKKEPQNARERVRQMLEREDKQQKTVADDDEDEDDLPVAPRRLQRRPAREPTPEQQESLQQNRRNPSSPGLFVSSPARSSPSRGLQHTNSDSESDDLPAIKSDRFKALVEKKRQERLAREAREEAERAERRARQEKLSSELDALDSNDDDVSNIDDDEGGHTLTQKSARPSRKASKKAIEEMNRETQRMARSMQLAHEAKTRKKFTKSSLFERFNFKPAGLAPEPIVQPASSSRPTTPQSDVEMADADTPPSSPPSAKAATAAPIAIRTDNNDDEDLPTLEEISSSPHARPIDKGKGKAIDVPEEQPAEVNQPKKRVHVRLPNLLKTLAADPDDELEITATVQDKVKAVFDNVPLKTAQGSHSLQVLRALALVRSPDRSRGRGKKTPVGITNTELQASLQQRARQQAKLERERRLELLKSKGVVVQTMEEREKQMEEVEDIVAKAREEVQRLMEQEREAAKKEKKENAAADPLAWDDSDDEYEASENGAEVEAIELSGSEDEGEEADDESDAANPMFDDEAEDSHGKEEPEAGNDDDEQMEKPAVQRRRRRARNVNAVLSDDEGETQIKATPKPIKTTDQISPVAANGNSSAPGSVLRSAKKTFIPGMPVQGAAGLGLTQIFAGTMDDSQLSAANGPTQSMMPDFDQLPDSNFSATIDQCDDNIIENSQPLETQNESNMVRLNMSQSQMHGLDSLMRDYLDESQTIELSQDGGFQTYTPLKDRFVEPPLSTVATDIAGTMEDGPQASPLLRRGKLRRKADVEKALEPTQPIPTSLLTAPQDAFTKLKEQAKRNEKRRLTDAFNAKTSKAKEMVEQEAMESDDEYAGLGGVDGEDSDNESNASVQEMIDDATANNANDSKLAAFYADRARAEDEQQVEKLFKDITTGMLRRKRGADYDLSDSDDDGEARRRMKRRQFAKMQKALFSDERVKKMAEDPGNQAFLRTIEDRGSDDEMDILEIVESPSQRDSSQSPAPESQNAAPQTIPDSQPKQPARPALASLASAPTGAESSRAPASMRRTKNAKKPSNIGEVRETLSNLLEEPDASLITATEAGSDSEGEDGAPRSSDKENRSPRRAAVGVVDRISLKRGNSNASTSSGRLAFASALSSSAFKVPPLLRRATTNSSIMSTATTSTATTTSSSSASGAGFGDDKKIKKAAGKRSGVVSRAMPINEGQARLKESERRREEKKMKSAEKRRGMMAGLLGRGTFA
ncbi:DNA replication checkpoint mediator [Cordyceps fumosorosea ARSEF 2679]|uniref:DNA replication checkpoint mediator n=1 Tax=Cordyceps fumosorosea (strain ARSEF 2679) TaxID=1081104 RepID=A0A167QIV0_CORFA|nr:DNA replication checkpoint mediator [Cordyceps fumosorosea ARSEF 2679]OAA57679.1 DNA replication checkpoint mediator [Cordyceps fumosorosea ARSEF 2679]